MANSPPVDTRTAHRGYQLPQGDNFLADDVTRLIAALNAIDFDMANAASTLISSRSLAAAYLAMPADNGYLLDYVGAASGIAFTLPLISSVQAGYNLILRNSAAQAVSIATQGSDLVGGSSTYGLPPGAVVQIAVAGNTYKVLAYTQANNGFQQVSGAVTAPSYAFAADPSVGLYLPAAGQGALTATGANVLLFGGAGVLLTGAAGGFKGAGSLNAVKLYYNGQDIFLRADGTAAAPTYGFASEPSMGLYRAGTGVLGLATAGAAQFTLSAAGLTAAAATQVPGGAQAAGTINVADLYVQGASLSSQIAFGASGAAMAGASGGAKGSGSLNARDLWINGVSLGARLGLNGATGGVLNLADIQISGVSLLSQIQFGANGSILGGATGGAQGPGTINTRGVFINGQSIIVAQVQVSPGTALTTPRVNAAGTGFDYRSPAQVLADIGAQPALGYTPLSKGGDTISVLTVSGTLAVGAGASFASSLAVTGAATLNTLLTSGATALGGTLAVAGTSAFTGPLSTTNAVAVGTTLRVATNATIGGTLTVASGISSAGTLAASGATALGGTLTVAGNTTLLALNASNTTVAGTLAVTAGTALTSLTTSGNAAIGGVLTTTGSATIGGTFTAAAASSFSGPLNASQGVYVNNGPLVVGAGTLTVSGQATLQAGLAVAGATALNTLSTSGNTTIGGSLTVSGAITYSSQSVTTLNVAANHTVGGTLTAAGLIAALGNIHFSTGGQLFSDDNSLGVSLNQANALGSSVGANTACANFVTPLGGGVSYFRFTHQRHRIDATNDWTSVRSRLQHFTASAGAQSFIEWNSPNAQNTLAFGVLNNGVEQVPLSVHPGNFISTGDIYSTGTHGVFALSFAITSDERLKDNLALLAEEDALRFVREVEPLSFTYREAAADPFRVHYGYRAQDVARKGFGHLVHAAPRPGMDAFAHGDLRVPDDHALALNQISVIPMLHAALRGVLDRLDAQEAELARLRAGRPAGAPPEQ